METPVADGRTACMCKDRRREQVTADGLECLESDYLFVT